MANARLKISQPDADNVAAAGVALFGSIGYAVVLENDDNTNVARWKYELLDAPAASGLAVGVLSDGTSPSVTFTPDVRGGYLARVWTKDTGGVWRRSTPLTFGVQLASGLFIPPFGARDVSVNFAGQTRGTAKFLEEWLLEIETLRAQVAGLSGGSVPQPFKLPGRLVTHADSPVAINPASDFEIFVDTTGGDVTVLLPNSPSGRDSYRVTSHTGSGNITIDSNSGPKIHDVLGGSLTYALPARDSITLVQLASAAVPAGYWSIV